MNILVSVILPVNKDDGFLKEAIESILCQTYCNIELLIIANNCTDELWDLIDSYQKKDSRIKPYRLEIGGLCFALNFGLEKASGVYVARMDADDISDPNRLKKQVEYLNLNSKISIVGTQINYIDDTGNLKEVKAAILPLEHIELRKISYYKCPLYHPTVMFRKESILNLGGYKYGFYGEDYELWLRCIHAGYLISNLNEPLLKYRVHLEQLSSSSVNKNIYISQMLKIFYKLHGDMEYLIGICIQLKFLQIAIIKTSKFRKFLKGF